MTDALDEARDDDYCYVTTRGRVTGRPHEIEIWFVLDGATVFLLSGGGDRSDWVRNLVADPAVSVASRDVTCDATARVVEPRDRRGRTARRLVFEKYQPRDDGSLASWRARSLPVALDLERGRLSRRPPRPRRGRARAPPGTPRCRHRRPRPPARAHAGVAPGSTSAGRGATVRPTRSRRRHRAGAPSQRSTAGAADASPRPETRTGAPPASSSSAMTGSGWTRAGGGPGIAPGHGAAPVPSASLWGSPHGTQRTRSLGARPPPTTAVATASCPSMAWRRARTRSARSSAAASPPQNPSCRHRAGTTRSGARRSSTKPLITWSRVSIWSSRPVEPSLELPAHAATSAAAVSPPSWRQHGRGARRARSRPPPRSDRTRARAPRGARAAGRRAPSRRTPLRRHATRADPARPSDEIGGGGAGGPHLAPTGREPVRAGPSTPKRASTDGAGSAARSPRVRRPRRVRRSASATPSSGALHHVDQDADRPRREERRVAPGGTTCTAPGAATRVASRAANAPSATPTRRRELPRRQPPRASGGQRLVAAEVARRPGVGNVSTPGRSSTTAGVIGSIARATASNGRFGRGVAVDDGQRPRSGLRLRVGGDQHDALGTASGDAAQRRAARASLDHHDRDAVERGIATTHRAQRPRGAPEREGALGLHERVSPLVELDVSRARAAPRPLTVTRRERSEQPDSGSEACPVTSCGGQTERGLAGPARARDRDRDEHRAALPGASREPARLTARAWRGTSASTRVIPSSRAATVVAHRSAAPHARPRSARGPRPRQRPPRARGSGRGRPPRPTHQLRWRPRPARRRSTWRPRPGLPPPRPRCPAGARRAGGSGRAHLPPAATVRRRV